MNFLTALSASWPIWAFIAAMTVLAFWLERRGRNFDPYADRHTEPPSRLDLMDRGCCGAVTAEGWVCDRAAGHAGVHCDSTKGGELGSARWGWVA